MDEILQLISCKQWNAIPFIPVIITIVVQAFALILAGNLRNRVRNELNSAGIQRDATKERVLHITDDVALLLGLYSGIFPLCGTLAITLLSAHLLPSVVVIVYFVLGFALVFPLWASSPLGDLSEKFIYGPDLKFPERLLFQLRIESWGSLINLLAILGTAGIMLCVAIIQLPDNCFPRS